MDDCPFCQLQTEGSRIIRTGKLSTVLLSNPRIVEGHTLVIPNRHVEKPWELTSQEILAIFEDIKFVEAKLLDFMAAGCDIRQNYRPFIPQGRTKVDHVHFHVLPRTFEDDLYQASMKFETQLFQDLAADERQRMQAIFKS